MLTIDIYNENCVLAGHEVPQSARHYDDPAEGHDWTGYEATEEKANITK